MVVRSGNNFTYLSGIAYPGTLARHQDLADSVRAVLLVWPRRGEPVVVLDYAAEGLTRDRSWIRRQEVYEPYVETAYGRLAKVLRVAPSLDVRPNIAMPDAETLKALLSHRFHAMTDYYRNVMLPALREDAHQAGVNLKSLPRRMRKALADNGRWLDPQAREKLHDIVARSPRLATLVEYRARLAAVLEERQQDAATTLARLQEWCHEAEASGNRALQEFAARLRGYALRPALARAH